jgi:integrase
MGRIYKRGKTWWIQYYQRGQLFRESSGAQLKSVASTLLKKREGEIVDGRLPALQAERTTFEALTRLYFQDYEINRKKSLARAKQHTQQLKKFFKGFLTLEITTEKLHAYIAKRQKEKAANGTINREFTALKRMFNLAARQTPPLVLSIPFIPHLRENNVRKGFFTEEEYKLLRAALPDHMKVPFILAYWTGMRAGEIIGLKWDQVNLDERMDPLRARYHKDGTRESDSDGP